MKLMMIIMFMIISLCQLQSQEKISMQDTSFAYKTWLQKQSSQQEQNISDSIQNTINIQKFTNAMGTPVRFETTHIVGGTAGTLAALSTVSSIICFASASENENSALTLAGALNLGISVVFWTQAFKTEHWAVYPNGTALRIDFIP